MNKQNSFTPESSRRDFLKTSAVAVAGLGLASAMAPPVHAAGSDTLKIALIGCGNRGTGALVQALSTKGPVQLWALADTFSDRLESCLAHVEREMKGDERGRRGSRAGRRITEKVSDRINLPKERRFVGLDAYRKAIDSGVDVVLMAQSPGYRAQHFEYAVRAGKHVFMEKPVATDPTGIRRILVAAEEAKKKNLKVGVGLQRRHQPSYHEAIQKIRDGAIGDLVALRCYWNGGHPAKQPYPRTGLTELEYQVRNWYFFSWLSGDHICEQHVHNLDVCNWIKDDHPAQAEGLGGRQVRTGKEYGNIYDHHAVEFTYADGTKMFSQCRQIPGCANNVSESARGTRGLMNLNATRAELLVGGKRKWHVAGGKNGYANNAYQVEHDALFAAIRNDEPYNEAEYGAHSTMTAILGRMATYSGQIVSWDAAIQSNHKTTTDAENWDAPAPVKPNSDGWYAVAMPGVTKVV
ncbi:MAG TPA: Gfo/Idh/MocA family oxidoreductase [Lacipirellulaceae bacterium]|nr:Gfo/Idh/MocA family oxidoreductase [Lacipirellulaceae bacterium]